MRDVAAEMHRHRFFSGMSDAMQDRLAGCSEFVSFAAGETILKEGAPANSFYAIRSGRVSVGVRTPNRGLAVIDTLHDGEILGWSWLIKPFRWTYEAVATEPVRAIEFHADCIRPYLDEEPAAGYELVTRIAGVMAERLQSAGLRLIDIYGVHDDH
jgi:CRP/FNR family transcriptional regulator, cyclic AMP receptor protein